MREKTRVVYALRRNWDGKLYSLVGKLPMTFESNEEAEGRGLPAQTQLWVSLHGRCVCA